MLRSKLLAVGDYLTSHLGISNLQPGFTCRPWGNTTHCLDLTMDKSSLIPKKQNNVCFPTNPLSAGRQHSLIPARSHQSLPAAGGLWSQRYHNRGKKTSKPEPWPVCSRVTALGSLSQQALCQNYKARESLWVELIANDFFNQREIE